MLAERALGGAPLGERGVAAFRAAIAHQPGTTDLHIVGANIRVRVNKRLETVDLGVPAQEIVRALRETLSEDDEMRLQARGDVTVRLVGSWGLARVQLYRELDGVAAAVRFLSEEPPSFDKLGLPAPIRRYAAANNGLVVVTGPMGAGKSSLAAALVREMDDLGMDRHVRIIESPVEWIHTPKNIMTSHVSVGPRQHAATYVEAAQACRKSDVQAVLIGELFSDDGTVEAAIDLAATTALVIVTTHQPTVADALRSIVDAFPIESERRLRTLLSNAFVGGASLRLVPAANGAGVVAAAEYVPRTSAVRNMILSGDSTMLSAEIKKAQGGEMQSIDDHLMTLLESGAIAPRDAWLAAHDQTRFQSS
jgi:twitching motility protein PilT